MGDAAFPNDALGGNGTAIDQDLQHLPGQIPRQHERIEVQFQYHVAAGGRWLERDGEPAFAIDRPGKAILGLRPA